jgi:hypothetical protein
MLTNLVTWIKARLNEDTTWMGIIAIGLAVALIVVPAAFPPEIASLMSTNIQWLIGALFVGGLGGVIWREKPKAD